MSNLVSVMGLIDILLDGLRMLTHLIDEGIYTIIQIAYQVFAALANATLLSDEAGVVLVGKIMSRVYIVMAIVMVFVLAFNLLQYIIDPDKINDKKVGATAFVKDVIIAIAIISFTPMLFTKLYSLQSKILESNVIGNLILGGTDSELAKVPENFPNSDEDKANISYMAYAMKNGANSMTATVYTAFLYPNISKSGGEAADGQLWTAMDCEGIDVRGSKPEGWDDDVFKYCQRYEYVKLRGDLTAFDDFITNDKFNFTPFLSTVAGIVLLFFILSFCVNMAKRVGKLAVIQLIAPVPAVLEILPNKKGVRENWFKTLIQVYLETFEYLLIMYLIIFLISLVPTAVSSILQNLGLDSLVSVFTSVFLIYGLLQFGKEAPKLLMDLLGIKESGTLKEAFQRATHMAGATASAIGAGSTTLARRGVSTVRNTYNAAKSGDVGTAAKAFGGGLVGMGAGSIGAFARGAYINRTGGFKGIAGRTRTAISQNDVAIRRMSSRLSSGAQGVGGYASSFKNAQGFKGKAKAIFGPGINAAIDGAKNGVVSRWAGASPYQIKKDTEAVHQEYKRLYDDGVASIWKNDAQFSSADAEYKKYKNMIDSGAVSASDTDKVTGLTYQKLMENAEKMRDARQGAVLKEKKLQFMEAAGKLNNFIELHQGIEGITSSKINLDDIVAISSDTDAAARLSDLDALVKDGGFKPVLEGLAKDADYQKERVEEKLRADAKEAAKKAAEQKDKK